LYIYVSVIHICITIRKSFHLSLCNQLSNTHPQFHRCWNFSISRTPWVFWVFWDLLPVLFLRYSSAFLLGTWWPQKSKNSRRTHGYIHSWIQQDIWEQYHRGTMGLEGGDFLSVGGEGRNYAGGLMKFGLSISDLSPKYFGGLFCFLWVK